MAVFNNLQDQGIIENYVKIIDNIHDNNITIIQIHKDTDKQKIGKVVRQVDMISLRFTASLESIFQKLNAEELLLT